METEDVALQAEAGARGEESRGAAAGAEAGARGEAQVQSG